MNMQPTLTKILDHIKPIEGVSALVLGGSRARGTASPESDIDIGIYYDSDKGLDIAGLRRAAALLDDEGREDLVTEIGGWGPWINGGGWLKVNRVPVDLLFRDRHKVARIVDQCVAGTVTIDYQPGHPHGFASSIYAAEVALCHPLWDPSGVVERLKAGTTPYPPKLKQAVVRTFFWEAAFGLDTGQKGIYKTDISYIAGCWFRSVACLNQVLFAMNETYLMNEKGATAIADTFGIVPDHYAHRIHEAFHLLREDRACLEKSHRLLRELVEEIGLLLKRTSPGDDQASLERDGFGE